MLQSSFGMRNKEYSYSVLHSTGEKLESTPDKSKCMMVAHNPLAELISKFDPWMWDQSFSWQYPWFFDATAVSLSILWPSVQLGSTSQVVRLISVCTSGLSRMAAWWERSGAVGAYLRCAGTVKGTKWLHAFPITLYVCWIFVCRTLARFIRLGLHFIFVSTDIYLSIVS
jgi:hypothetical protein